MSGLLAKSQAHLVLWTFSSSRFPRWLINISGGIALICIGRWRSVCPMRLIWYPGLPGVIQQQSAWSLIVSLGLGRKHAGSDCPLLCFYHRWTTTKSRWRRQSWWVVCKSIQHLKQVLHVKWEKGGAFHRLRTDTFRYQYFVKFSNFINTYKYIRYSYTLTNDAMFVVYQDSEYIL